MNNTVLIVDDAMTMRKMVSFTLRGNGYQTVEAGDGIAALAMLGQHIVDLIITDVNMPKMDGIEFTRQARTALKGRHVPILILTTESELEKKNQARAAGATGWIVKPFQQEQLLAVVSKVLPFAAPAT
ncbi:MAG: response regulator [Opitutaceae bacterium]|jgi:two-component system chemotaxis response regulator CheY